MHTLGDLGMGKRDTMETIIMQVEKEDDINLLLFCNRFFFQEAEAFLGSMWEDSGKGSVAIEVHHRFAPSINNVVSLRSSLMCLKCTVY